MLNCNAHMQCESAMQQLRHDVDRMHLRCMLSRVHKVLRQVSHIQEFPSVFLHVHAECIDIVFKDGLKDAATHRPQIVHFLTREQTS